MSTIEPIAETIRGRLEAKNAARDRALADSRQVIRFAANAIRAVHRGEFDDASRLLDQAGENLAATRSALETFPDLYWAGYVQDSYKEFSEARLTLAVVRGDPLPSPEDLGAEDAAYLNGLGETAGELRRHVLDLIRLSEWQECERTLQAMDDIYGVLVTMDFPDAVTGGLRRTTDMVRGVLERTRGDLTVSLRQHQLELALARVEGRLQPRGTE